MPYAAGQEPGRSPSECQQNGAQARPPRGRRRAAPRRPRRSPEPGERQRDAERSRELILAAATKEFAARGFAGARVASIAERAGVNQQLISYYFGGKQGLFDALRQQWLAREAMIANPAMPVEQVVAGYFDARAADPDGARLLLWQALGDRPATSTSRRSKPASARRSRTCAGASAKANCPASSTRSSSWSSRGPP